MQLSTSWFTHKTILYACVHCMHMFDLVPLRIALAARWQVDHAFSLKWRGFPPEMGPTQAPRSQKNMDGASTRDFV